jgi:hypothetical protein
MSRQIRSLSVVLAVIVGVVFQAQPAWGQAAADAPNSTWHLTGSSPESYEAGWFGGANAAFYLRSRTPPLGGGFGTWMKYGQAGSYLGKRLRLRANIEPKEVSGWAGIWMRVDGKNGKLLEFDNMQDRPIRGTTPPHPYEVVLDVPSDATGFGYGILLAGVGDLKVSDIVLESVSTDVATTNLQSHENKWFFLAGSMPGMYTAGLIAGPGSGYYLRSTSDAPIDGFGTWMTMVDAAPYLGKRVRLRATVSTKDVKGSVGLWMRVDSGEKPTDSNSRPSMLAFDNMSDRLITGTSEAKQYDVVLSVPMGATKIAYGVLLNDRGEARTSDLKLEIVADTVPLTGNLSR